MIAGGEGWRPLRRALGWTGLLLGVNAGGSWGLDAAGVADRLLSASPGALVLLPLVVLFLAARLGLYFIAPGMVLRGLVIGVVERRKTKVSS